MTTTTIKISSSWACDAEKAYRALPEHFKDVCTPSSATSELIVQIDGTQGLSDPIIAEIADYLRSDEAHERSAEIELERDSDD